MSEAEHARMEVEILALLNEPTIETTPVALPTPAELLEDK